MRSAMTIVMTF